ncbi:MAG: 50S ribosomal protein L35 [Armatimonadetes bacterium]|nr:50S ribosomal protein L35 [Armatimonadota bacterium]
MGKMKTKKAAAKRLKVTGTGRLVSRSTKLNHLLSKKSRRVKRNLKQGTEVTGGFKDQVGKLLPYA